MSQTLPAGLPTDSAEQGARIGVDERSEIVDLVAAREARFDAVTPERVGEQRVRRAIELGRTDDIAASIGEGEKGVAERGLARRNGKGRRAALEQVDAPFQDVDCRIGDPAVAEPFDFEIEQRCAMIGALELIGDVLVDRRRHGARRRIVAKSPVKSDRLKSHSPSAAWRKPTKRAKSAASQHIHLVC